MKRYIVAIKRDRRHILLSSVLERINSIKGFRIIGDKDGSRTLIEADDSAIEQIKTLVNEDCWVEGEILHYTQD
jgi:hypothetical protein